MITKFDIIDPKSNFTTRLNIDVFSKDIEQNLLISKHLEMLDDAFFNKISVKSNGSEFDLYLPALPGKYELSYYRRSDRNRYVFANSNILITSNENVLINLDPYGNKCSGDNIADLFFINETINSLLQGNDWTVQEVVECFENILKFSDNIMQSLL